MNTSRPAITVVLGLAAGLLLAAGASAQGPADPPVFSLDDLPIGPITSPMYPGAGGLGAESPFGWWFPPLPLAPSPSLPATTPVPATDGDILEPGAAAPVPNINIFAPGQVGYLDALSANNRPLRKGLDMHLPFSVDRISKGQAGTAVNWQFMMNQQPADIFRSRRTFPEPGQYAGVGPVPPCGYAGPLSHVSNIPDGNFLLIDESRLTLTAMAAPGVLIPPDVEAMPIVEAGTHDNVDAYDWKPIDKDGDYVADRSCYFSINPDEAVMVGGSAADIAVALPGGAAASVWARSWQIGLDWCGEVENVDDIDALIVWDRPDDNGETGTLQPGRDYALFSLSYGSAALMPPAAAGSVGDIPTLGPGDIFFTDFRGCFWLYADAEEIGLEEIMAGSDEPMDNVDALEMLIPGDADCDGDIDAVDLANLGLSWDPSGSSGPHNWFDCDFDANGLIDAIDLATLGLHWWPAGTGDIGGTALPEPATLILLAVGCLGLYRRRD